MTLLLSLLACSTPVLSVDDAPETAGLHQRTITLTDGQVRADLIATWSRQCTSTGRMPGKGQSTCQDLFFAVAPIVSKAWTVDQPVNAWLHCPVDDRVSCEAYFRGQGGHTTGRVLSRYQTTADSGWVKAIHGGDQRSAEGAPIVYAENP